MQLCSGLRATWQGLHVRPFEVDLESSFCYVTQRSSLQLTRNFGLFGASLVGIHMGPRLFSSKLWMVPCSLVTNVLLLISASLLLLCSGFAVWVARKPEERITLYDGGICNMIACVLILLPLEDKWRLGRMFQEDVFSLYEIDHFDDTGLILAMLALAIFSSVCPFRSSRSWIIPVAGTISYSLTTLVCGAPTSNQSRRIFRDLQFICTFDFILIVTWLGSLDRERYTRRHLLDTEGIKQMLEVTEKSLKGYVDAWAILSDGQIVDSSPVIDEMLGVKAEGTNLLELLLEGDKLRFERFLVEIQRVKDCQKINISCKTSSGGTWEVEVFAVYITPGRIHIAFKEYTQMESCSAVDDGVPEIEAAAAFQDYNAMLADGIVDGVGEKKVQSDAMSMVSVRTGSTGVFRNFMDSAADPTGVNFSPLATLGQKEHWLLDRKVVQLKAPPDVLGSGGFGVVLKGSLLGSPVAVKIPHDKQHHRTAKHWPSLANELRILRRVHHPNIVLFFGAWIDTSDASVALVFELLAGAHLQKFMVEEHSMMGLSTRIDILCDITSAVWYLHTVPAIVHGDLKGVNIMIEHWRAKPRAKLLDFGLSAIMRKEVLCRGTTTRWSAPERLRFSEAAVETGADIYAIGLLLYLVSTARQPLGDFKLQQFVVAAKANCLPTPLWPTSSALANEYHELAMHCCSKFPGNRPPAEEVYSNLLLLSGHKGAQERSTVGSPFNHDEGVQGTLHCWLDAASPGFPMIDCTPSFSICFALDGNGGHNFLDWMSEPQSFEMWANLCCNNAQSAKHVFPLSGFQLVLRPPSLLILGMEICAQCTVDSKEDCAIDGEVYQMSLTEEYENEDPFILRVVLHHIKKRCVPSAPCTESWPQML